MSADEHAVLADLRDAWERRDWAAARAHLEVLVVALGARGLVVRVPSAEPARPAAPPG